MLSVFSVAKIMNFSEMNLKSRKEVGCLTKFKGEKVRR